MRAHCSGRHSRCSPNQVESGELLGRFSTWPRVDPKNLVRFSMEELNITVSRSYRIQGSLHAGSPVTGRLRSCWAADALL